jgi:Ribosomal protein S4 and related proteins
MPNINKYSKTRPYFSMSFNKYNLYNLKFLNKTTLFGKKVRKFKKRMTIYKRQLMAKQRLRKYYGNLKESQFYSLYKKASFYKGAPSSNLFILLERRLDVILFRAGFVPSIYSSRQLISHGHILVNNKKVTIPSYMVQNNDVISVAPNSINIVKTLLSKKLNPSPKMKKFIKRYVVVPSYLEVNYNIFSIILVKTPSTKKIPYPIKFSKKLIDKFYSRS